MNSSSDRCGLVVVGVGRMGQHHARTVAAYDGAGLLAVVDGDAERAETVADAYGCAAHGTVEEAIGALGDRIGAAVIAVPTRWHAEAAVPFLERGIACLIEKPLAPNLDEARRLADLAGRHGATLQVGHTERFNPAVRAVAEMGLTPRFMEVDRVSPMTFRSMDVGVVMDVMIHDLDIVLSFARSPIARLDATGIGLLTANEDIANVRIVFASGCVANITASRVALKTARTMRLFSESAYVSLDYAKRRGVVVSRGANEAALQRLREQLAEGRDLSGTDYGELIDVQELSMESLAGSPDPLTAQLAAFLDAARTGASPVVSAADGCAAIDAAERIIAAIGAHRWQDLDDPLFQSGSPAAGR